MIVRMIACVRTRVRACVLTCVCVCVFTRHNYKTELGRNGARLTHRLLFVMKKFMVHVEFRKNPISHWQSRRYLLLY